MTITPPSDLATAAPGLYLVYCLAGATVYTSPIQPGDSIHAIDYLPAATALAMAYGVHDELLDVEIIEIREGDCIILDCETIDMERMP